MYDTEKRAIVESVTTHPRIDGIALDEAAEQLLVGSPLHAAVLRYDAETLRRVPDLRTTFGVRSLALQASRGLLLCVSLVTNRLDAIDIESGRTLARYQVGP